MPVDDHEKHDKKDGTPASAAEETKPDPAKEVEHLPAPLPPPPPGGNLQVQLGMALMQRSSFDRLPPEMQQAIVRLVDQMDDRGYQFALKSLDHEAGLTTKEIDDRGKGRKQALWFIGILAVLGLAAGTTVACLLIVAKQYDMAHTMMMSGIGVVTSLLGGAGITVLLQKTLGGK